MKEQMCVHAHQEVDLQRKLTLNLTEIIYKVHSRCLVNILSQRKNKMHIHTNYGKFTTKCPKKRATVYPCFLLLHTVESMWTRKSEVRVYVYLFGSVS